MPHGDEQNIFQITERRLGNQLYTFIIFVVDRSSQIQHITAFLSSWYPEVTI